MSKKIKALIACEESQAVTKALRKRGISAFSCDIQPCESFNEWHLQVNVLELLKLEWDLVIAFPPCTHLSVSGARYFAAKRADGRQQQGVNFFMQFTNLNCPWAIENPVGIMSSIYRKPDQIIQPYEFGHDASKKTCLWLNNLPQLKPTKYIEGRLVCCGMEINEGLGKYGCPNCCGENIAKRRWSNQTLSGQNKLAPSKDRAKQRSKTYSGIAEAMAEQWSKYLINQKAIS